MNGISHFTSHSLNRREESAHKFCRNVEGSHFVRHAQTVVTHGGCCPSIVLSASIRAGTGYTAKL